MLRAASKVNMENGTRLAAVDMGSNSFRLEIGRLDRGQIHRTDYVKETVRLGAGLTEDKILTPAAMERGWACLARFGERLAGFPRAQVRAVATQTLREATNRDEFVARAEQLLGFPIEVIPGREEARLIYIGAARLLPQSNERRLVIDIGGRSTELIIGRAYSPKQTESFKAGSVSWTQRFFEGGQLTRKAFDAADMAAKALLAEVPQLYPQDAWDCAYGSSGTIGAVADTLAQAGQCSEGATGGITRAGLDWLRERLIKAGSAQELRIAGIRDDRKPIIAGGLAVLSALVDLLGIDTLYPAQGALRQGVLYDLIDREHDATDMRTATVYRLAEQFGVDASQARRVTNTAMHLFDSVQARAKPDMPAPTPEAMAQARKELERAAWLHEVGTAISHSGYHKHGAYILRNADAAGFATPELARVGQLVLCQRGKLLRPEAQNLFPQQATQSDWANPLWVQQLACMRLAVILCHARRDPLLAGIHLRCRTSKNTPRMVLGVPARWVQQSPLSWHLLEEEAQNWARSPWQLVLEVDA
jgi:exopolyphosphatase/guanosine-5'-triphosphate,3'-diphosphate pyrophosphatase